MDFNLVFSSRESSTDYNNTSVNIDDCNETFTFHFSHLIKVWSSPVNFPLLLCVLCPLQATLNRQRHNMSAGLKTDEAIKHS